MKDRRLIPAGEIKVGISYESYYIPGYIYTVKDFTEWASIPGANILVEYLGCRRSGWASLADLSRSIKCDESEREMMVRKCEEFINIREKKNKFIPITNEEAEIDARAIVAEINKKGVVHLLGKIEGFIAGANPNHKNFGEACWWVEQIRRIVNGEPTK